MERWHVFFSGTVQGVGFRYTAVRAARPAGITGWVRNLADGRVEMVAEGSAAALRQMLDEVRQAMAGNVTGHTLQKQVATGEFAEFTVRY